MYITQEYKGRMPSFMCMRVFAYLRKKAKPVSFQEFANNRCLPPPPPPLWAFNPRTSVASPSCDLEEGMLLPPPPPPPPPPLSRGAGWEEDAGSHRRRREIAPWREKLARIRRLDGWRGGSEWGRCQWHKRGTKERQKSRAPNEKGLLLFSAAQKPNLPSQWAVREKEREIEVGT